MYIYIYMYIFICHTYYICYEQVQVKRMVYHPRMLEEFNEFQRVKMYIS